jgi:predicted permease
MATLMLGIGGATAVFSLVYGVILKPLPYAQPERLVRIFESSEKRGHSLFSASVPNYLSWRERVRSMELAALSGQNFTFHDDGEPERLTALAATAAFAPLLGESMALGRWFLPEEEQQGRHRVLVLGHDFWRRRFAQDRGVLGRPLLLNGAPYNIVGVAQPGFRFGADSGLWTPLIINPGEDRGNHYITVIGRLRPGYTIAQARAEMEAIARDLEREFPKTNETWTVRLTPLNEWMAGERAPAALLVLLAATVLVLLIACANIANLLLARAAAREKEFAIRAALGAGAGRLARQLLTESVLLALCGGIAGMAAGWWIVSASRLWLAEFVPRAAEVTLDWAVLAFALGSTLLTGVAFGMAPVWHAFRRRLAKPLTQASRTTASHLRSRLRNGLVVAQMALATVLLIGAGLLLQSFIRLQYVSPGFETDNLLTARVALPRVKYNGAKFGVAAAAISESLRAAPGIAAASSATGIPFGIGGDSSTSLTAGAGFTSASSRWVERGFFETMAIPLLRGRPFGPGDHSDGSPKVILSREMARALFGDSDPVGRQLRAETGKAFEVIGVAGDVRLRRLSEAPQRIAYFPIAQTGFWPNLNVVIRTNGHPDAAVAALRQSVRTVDPALPIFDIAPVDQRIDDSARQTRLETSLLAAFGTVALLLGALGVYGVLAFLVGRRTQELGVRKALGARNWQLVAMVMSQGMRMAVWGAVIGTTAAYGATQLLTGLLYGVGPRDQATFAAAPLLLAVVALLASYLPARAAAAVDASVALRSE